jgi:hypothetical protein
MIAQTHTGPQATLSDSPEGIRCTCCGAVVPRRESKVCATCRRPMCPACTRWYGHHMMVCDDCFLTVW